MSILVSCRVSGIPAQARLLSYSPFRDGRRGHIDSWLPDEEEQLEYEILDRRGYSASWLERKLTPQTAQISRLPSSPRDGRSLRLRANTPPSTKNNPQNCGTFPLSSGLTIPTERKAPHATRNKGRVN